MRNCLAACLIILLGKSAALAAEKTGDSAGKFSCPPLPPLSRPAENVFELKPQDIKVVMALGDSVTAGFAMMGDDHGVIGDIDEYRGHSWCIGGDANATTIAAFLRHYTPNIVGASLGSHLVELCYGALCPPYQYHPEKDVFNAAQSGAMIPDLLKHEFTYLLDQLQKNTQVNMKEDWKLLFILIGFNDLCLACSEKVPFLTPDDFEKHLRELLEEIRTRIPRVFVNLVQVFNISLIYNKTQESEHCKTIHRLFPIECICAFDPGREGNKLRNELDTACQNYNERMSKVASDYQQKKYPDFAVVVQPGFRDGTAKGTPLSFASTVDCFHPSLECHEAMAKVIWNNMLTPSDKKTSTFDFEAPFICPDNSTLIYTN